jgi:hypothetical protein
MLPGIGRFMAAPDAAARVLVAVGTTGSAAYVATSTDGASWTSQTVSGSPLNGVCYSSSLDLHCAVGNAGTILTSDDAGVTWTSRTSGTSLALTGVAWNGSIFVATCINTDKVFSSPDGVTWTQRTAPYGSGPFNDVFVQGTSFIVVGSDGSGNGRAAYSSNGTSWTGAASMVSGSYQGVGGSTSMLVTVGGSGKIATSTDGGANWTAQTSGTAFGLFDVEWNGSVFCAVGPAQVRTSPDGVTWTDRTGSIARNLYGIVWTGNQFVAVGSSSGPLTPRVLTSPDGTTWTEQSIGLSGAGFEAVCI